MSFESSHHEQSDRSRREKLALLNHLVSQTHCRRFDGGPERELISQIEGTISFLTHSLNDTPNVQERPLQAPPAKHHHTNPHGVVFGIGTPQAFSANDIQANTTTRFAPNERKVYILGKGWLSTSTELTLTPPNSASDDTTPIAQDRQKHTLGQRLHNGVQQAIHTLNAACQRILRACIVACVFFLLGSTQIVVGHICLTITTLAHFLGSAVQPDVLKQLDTTGHTFIHAGHIDWLTLPHRCRLALGIS